MHCCMQLKIVEEDYKMPIVSYEDFKNKRMQLLAEMKTIVRQVERLQKLGLSKVEMDALATRVENLEKDNFKVLVIGEFKRGKSTFINALLGEELLPADVAPCTAVINEVVYGPDKKAELYFKQPLPDGLKMGLIPAKAQQHLQKYYGSAQVPPMEISPEELWDYVTIQDYRQEQTAAVRETPYSRAVLHYPALLCRDGVELIDSPGLNENGTRTKVTREYLQQADAILFVMRCSVAGSETEREFLEYEIKQSGHKDIFFIFNAIDEIKPEGQCQRLKKRLTEDFAKETELGEKGVFFVNSIGALEAKEKHDAAAVRTTGLPELEEALSEYLRNSRGTSKLYSNILYSERYIDTLCREQVENYQESLDQDVEKQKKNLKAALPQLDDAMKRKDAVEGKIENWKAERRNEICYRIGNQYECVINKVPDFVKELDLENRMTVNPFKQKERKEALEQEITEKLNQFVNQEMNKWFQKDLAQCMETRVEELGKELGREVDQFYNHLDNFRYDVSNVKKARNIAGWDRLIGTVLGTVTMGPIYGAIGATQGTGSVLKRSALTWGALIAFAAIPAVTPTALGIALLGAAFGGGALQVATGGKVLENKYKEVLIKNTVKQMKESKDLVAQRYTESIITHVAQQLNKIPVAMQKEIEQERGKVNALRQDMETSEQAREEKKKELAEILNELRAVETHLGELEMKLK